MSWNTLIKDSFTDADNTYLYNHTPEIGGWVVTGNGAFIKDNAIVTGESIGSIVSLSHNCYVQAKIISPSGLSPNSFVFNLYMNQVGESHDMLTATIRDTTTDEFYLNSTYIPELDTGHTSGSLYRIERIGNTVYLYRNGILITTLTGSGGNGYNFGVHISNPFVVGYRVDDYEAGELIEGTGNFGSQLQIIDNEVSMVQRSINSGTMRKYIHTGTLVEREVQMLPIPIPPPAVVPITVIPSPPNPVSVPSASSSRGGGRASGGTMGRLIYITFCFEYITGGVTGTSGYKCIHISTGE